jgi:glycosyltransferase involved in cell wall biosynthesis
LRGRADVELLPELLASLAGQTVVRNAEIDVFVLDNDASATAARVVEDARSRFPFPLHYEHVAKAGLTFVRNRALEIAQDRFDYIAMIDDDEVPEPQWLDELLRTAQRTGVEVVVGPVFPVLSADAPHWIATLRAKETPVHPDCALIGEGWSCNALVSTKAVAALKLRFDPALNFTGGEDQLFFRQMVAGGSTIAFAG